MAYNNFYAFNLITFSLGVFAMMLSYMQNCEENYLKKL